MTAYSQYSKLFRKQSKLALLYFQQVLCIATIGGDNFHITSNWNFFAQGLYVHPHDSFTSTLPYPFHLFLHFSSHFLLFLSSSFHFTSFLSVFTSFHIFFTSLIHLYTQIPIHQYPRKRSHSVLKNHQEFKTTTNARKVHRDPTGISFT